jgi:hypothetical protein
MQASPAALRRVLLRTSSRRPPARNRLPGRSRIGGKAAAPPPLSSSVRLGTPGDFAARNGGAAPFAWKGHAKGESHAAGSPAEGALLAERSCVRDRPLSRHRGTATPWHAPPANRHRSTPHGGWAPTVREWRPGTCPLRTDIHDGRRVAQEQATRWSPRLYSVCRPRSWPARAWASILLDQRPRNPPSEQGSAGPSHAVALRCTGVPPAVVGHGRRFPSSAVGSSRLRSP